jgi:hypothetical protein
MGDCEKYRKDARDGVKLQQIDESLLSVFCWKQETELQAHVFEINSGHVFSRRPLPEMSLKLCSFGKSPCAALFRGRACLIGRW